MNYFGHVISTESFQVNPNKIKAIREIPKPSNKQGILRGLGMANCVQKFAPNVALTTTLRKRKKQYFRDEHVHGKCFSEIKKNKKSTSPKIFQL